MIIIIFKNYVEIIGHRFYIVVKFGINILKQKEKVKDLIPTMNDRHKIQSSVSAIIQHSKEIFFSIHSTAK